MPSLFSAISRKKCRTPVALRYLPGVGLRLSGNTSSRRRTGSRLSCQIQGPHPLPHVIMPQPPPAAAPDGNAVPSEALRKSRTGPSSGILFCAPVFPQRTRRERPWFSGPRTPSRGGCCSRRHWKPEKDDAIIYLDSEAGGERDEASSSRWGRYQSYQGATSRHAGRLDKAAWELVDYGSRANGSGRGPDRGGPSLQPLKFHSVV